MAEVILALDVTSLDETRRLLDRLPDLRWAKVGPILFLQSGPAVIEELHKRGIQVFLDLKWHDIPNTVAEAARQAANVGVALATVHALGGAEMIGAAAEAGGGMRIAAVSVLTSHSPDSYWRVVGRGGGGLGDEVVRLARMAVDAGARAVVAAPPEVAGVRAGVGPDPWIVTPGIRPSGSALDDHQRAATPREAVERGSTHLVVGRPILRAEDPGAVYQQLCEVAT